MRRGTRLQPDPAARQSGKERYYLAAPQLLAQNHCTARIDTVNLKNMLRQIQPDRRNLTHGWLALMGYFTNHHSGTWMPFGGHPPHHSTTSSARARIKGGIVRPSEWAVLRFTTNRT